MDDADARRDEAESLEGLLAPFQELVTLAVALEFHVHVQPQRFRRAGEIDLHRVIDDEIDRHERLDDFRIAAECLHRAAHRREIDHERHAGEILQDDSRDDERNLFVRGRLRVPVRERLDILAPDFFAVAISQDRFEHDADADRQPRDRPDALFFRARERMEKSFAAVPGVELCQRFEFVASLQLRQFRFDLVEIGKLARVVVAFRVLDHAFAVDDKGRAFRHPAHTQVHLRQERVVDHVVAASRPCARNRSGGTR